MLSNVYGFSCISYVAVAHWVMSLEYYVAPPERVDEIFETRINLIQH